MPSMCMSVLFTSCMQCSPLEGLVCPEPPTLVVSGDLAKRILFIILKSLGAHGVALLLGGMLLILGCIKLSFGKLIFCRKTKAEAMAEELKKKGLVNQQGGSCSKTGNLHAIHSTSLWTDQVELAQG